VAGFSRLLWGSSRRTVGRFPLGARPAWPGAPPVAYCLFLHAAALKPLIASYLPLSPSSSRSADFLDRILVFHVAASILPSFSRRGKHGQGESRARGGEHTPLTPGGKSWALWIAALLVCFHFGVREESIPARCEGDVAASRRRTWRNEAPRLARIRRSILSTSIISGHTGSPRQVASSAHAHRLYRPARLRPKPPRTRTLEILPPVCPTIPCDLLAPRSQSRLGHAVSRLGMVVSV